MLPLLSFLLITGLSLSLGEIITELTCEDVTDFGVAGSILFKTSKNVLSQDDVPVNFYITTDKNKNFVRLNPGDWSWIQDSWDVYQKTYIIIHGYKSGGTKAWVKEMASKLVEIKKGNVIVVDWDEASHVFNYADAAKNTQIVSARTAKFFYELRREVEKLDPDEANPLWNHLHFIGHSLGAQISGQVSYALKGYSNFWNIERITGLDPAKPCFSNKNIRGYLKLDKSDADFVDIIHTQAGLDGEIDGFGQREPIGHIDFYVNSGVVQPKCLGSIFTLNLETMICSHKLAYKYFLQSLKMPPNDTCAFRGYPWDGTFMHAQDKLTEKLQGPICYDCPEMGIYADQSKKTGIYLVIIGENEPFCSLEMGDEVNNIVKVFWKFKGRTSIFEN